MTDDWLLKLAAKLQPLPSIDVFNNNNFNYKLLYKLIKLLVENFLTTITMCEINPTKKNNHTLIARLDRAFFLAACGHFMLKSQNFRAGTFHWVPRGGLACPRRNRFMTASPQRPRYSFIPIWVSRRPSA